MPIFKVRVTRELTESANLEIEAETEREAEDQALDKADAGEVDTWEVDQGNTPRPAYIPNPDDTERKE